jgi:hypothetical protein
MTFLSYSLPMSAPQRMVWFAECDVCRVAHLGPFPNAPKVDQRAVAEGAGWRYQREHPMDTCPGCLARQPSEPDHTNGSGA